MTGAGAQEQLLRFGKVGVLGMALLALHFAGWSGVAAGALLALALYLYAILFGVGRALKAIPPVLLRVLGLIGLLLAVVAGAWSVATPAPGSVSAALLQLGLGATVCAAGGLVFLSIAGRAGAMGEAP